MRSGASSCANWCGRMPGGGGVTAHGALSGLGADDHPQYLTTGRGGMGTFVEILDICLEAAEGGQITGDILASARKYKLMY